MAFLSNPEKVIQAETWALKTPLSGMVAEFNRILERVYTPFFRRVRTVEADLDMIKTLSNKGPIVFVTKNNGAMEYRYFNFLFLKNALKPVRFATLSTTLFWWPFKKMILLARGHLSLFYKNPVSYNLSPDESLATHLEQGHNVLINVKISRDYLFGLLRQDPMKNLLSVVDFQSKSQQDIHIVPVQFLYDKHPEKTRRSLFDLLFGEKSCPGGLRKFLLLLMNYKKNPQTKFGNPLSLRQLVEERQGKTGRELAQNLLAEIESSLSIERARITGPKLIAKDAIIDEILSDSRFLNTLEEISPQSGRSFTELKGKAKNYLNEIAADVNYSYVHMIALVLDYLWDNIYDGLVIKHDQLNRIRDIAGKNPIVLVPMHRSHIDYLLISHIFYNHNITFPHVCAGNNMNFWPIGRLVRKCGGFFIRRSFSGNELYRESLYAYIKTLLKKTFCLEFYIEGTRSRTGKMIKPKFGILSQILRAYHEGVCADINFVPIAINYDQIIEQKSYRAESHGADKKKENAAELVKAHTVLGKKYGKVYIEFAKPVSLKEYLGNRALDKNDAQQTRAITEEFGHHLTYLMNKAAIVTPASLVALAALSFPQRSFTFDQVIDQINLFKDYLDHKEVTYSDLIHYSDRWAFSEAFTLLKNKGFIREMKTFEGSFYTVEPGSLVHLDYYKNNILHFFVSLVCTLKIILPLRPDESITLKDMVRRYEQLKTIFEEDFMFSSREPLKNHIQRVLAYCVSRGLVSTTDDFENLTRQVMPDGESDLLVLSSLLDNFLEAHLITLRYLKTQTLNAVEKSHIIREILEKAKPLYLTEPFRHPEALTRFNLETSVALCVKIGLLLTTHRTRDKTLYSTTEQNSHIEQWIAFVMELLGMTKSTHSVSEALPMSTLLVPLHKDSSHKQELH